MVSVFIVVWLFRLAPEDRVLVMPLGLILGGGVGNLIDRVNLGYVVDFISWHYHGWYWPAFNVADAAISVGAAAALWIALLGSSPQEAIPANDASRSE
jgi:signal peptidase II